MANNNIIPSVINDVETLEQIISCLEENITIETQGDCTAKTIFQILIRAASENDSIANVSKSLKNAPTDSNIFYHLKKLDDIDELEKSVNDALHSLAPNNIRNRKQKIAIDLNLVPYYGDPSEKEKPYIVKSKAQDGTTSFYCYATVYLIRKDKRITLAIKAVRKDEALLDVLKKII